MNANNPPQHGLRLSMATAPNLSAPLVAWLNGIVERFDTEGNLLYRGRNEVKRFCVAGEEVVVKRYRRHDAFKRLVYSFFRRSKAARAFTNGRRLRSLGYDTPAPLAAIDVWRGLWLVQCYYVSRPTADAPVRGPLIDTQPFDKALATAYARFVARMHDDGVLHKDLNPTNVLFRSQGGAYSFTLIDINRMRFYRGPVPKRASMHNLTLFWWLSPVYLYILKEYARRRGWTDADCRRAVAVKVRHDRYWRARKAVKRFLRRVGKTRA